MARRVDLLTERATQPKGTKERPPPAPGWARNPDSAILLLSLLAGRLGPCCRARGRSPRPHTDPQCGPTHSVSLRALA